MAYTDSQGISWLNWDHFQGEYTTPDMPDHSIDRDNGQYRVWAGSRIIHRCTDLAEAQGHVQMIHDDYFRSKVDY